MKIGLALLLIFLHEGGRADAEPASLFSVDADGLARISVAPPPSDSLTKPYFNTQLRQLFNVIERPAKKEDTEKVKFTVPDAPPPPPAMSPNVAFEKALDAVHANDVEVSEDIIKELKTLLQHSMFAAHATDVTFLTSLIEETVALSEGTKEAAANDIIMVTKGGQVKIPFKFHHMKGTPLGTPLFTGAPLDGNLAMEVKVPKWSPVEVGREGGLSLAPAPRIASPSKLRIIDHGAETYNNNLYRLMLFKMTPRQPLSYPIDNLDAIDADEEAWWIDDLSQIEDYLAVKEPSTIPYKAHQEEIIKASDTELEQNAEDIENIIAGFLKKAAEKKKDLFEDAQDLFEDAQDPFEDSEDIFKESLVIKKDNALKGPELDALPEEPKEALLVKEDVKSITNEVKNKNKNKKRDGKDKVEAEALKQKVKIETAIKLKQTIESEIAGQERALVALQKKFDKGKIVRKNFNKERNAISSRLAHLQKNLAEVTAKIPVTHPKEVVEEPAAKTKKKQKKKRNKQKKLESLPEDIEAEFLDGNPDFENEQLAGELQQPQEAKEHVSTPGIAQKIIGKASEMGQTLYRMGSGAMEKASRVASNIVGNKRSKSTPVSSSKKAKSLSHSSDDNRESSEGSWGGLQHFFAGLV